MRLSSSSITSIVFETRIIVEGSFIPVAAVARVLDKLSAPVTGFSGKTFTSVMVYWVGAFMGVSSFVV
jgi:hypothetical protein